MPSRSRVFPVCPRGRTSGCKNATISDKAGGSGFLPPCESFVPPLLLRRFDRSTYVWVANDDVKSRIKMIEKKASDPREGL
jgi:hypothetical protein